MHEVKRAARVSAHEEPDGTVVVTIDRGDRAQVLRVPQHLPGVRLGAGPVRLEPAGTGRKANRRID